MKKLFACVFASVCLIHLAHALGQIDIAYSPYTISQPGSYVVVKDLTTAINLDCIDIATSNVTIDLNGHTLYGAGTTTGSSGTGINDIGGTGNDKNITIFNGTVRDFRLYGIYLIGVNVHLERVNVYANRSEGIHLYDGGQVVDCDVSYNGNYGISCSQGGVIRDNTVSSNGSYGINCVGGLVVRDNTVFSNGSYGINASYGTVVRGNSIYSNLSDGINGANLTVLQNNVYGNHGNGIYVFNSLVENNNVENNKSNGILGGANRIINNFCQLNGTPAALGGKGAGINGTYANTIENNTLYDNDTGLLLTSSGNFYGGDMLHSNTVSVSTVAGNVQGTGSVGGFTEVIVPQSQPNFFTQQFAGFNNPVLRESPQAILRNLLW